MFASRNLKNINTSDCCARWKHLQARSWLIWSLLTGKRQTYGQRFGLWNFFWEWERNPAPKKAKNRKKRWKNMRKWSKFLGKYVRKVCSKKKNFFFFFRFQNFGKTCLCWNEKQEKKKSCLIQPTLPQRFTNAVHSPLDSALDKL